MSAYEQVKIIEIRGVYLYGNVLKNWYLSTCQNDVYPTLHYETHVLHSLRFYSCLIFFVKYVKYWLYNSVLKFAVVCVCLNHIRSSPIRFNLLSYRLRNTLTYLEWFIACVSIKMAKERNLYNEHCVPIDRELAGLRI